MIAEGGKYRLVGFAELGEAHDHKERMPSDTLITNKVIFFLCTSVHTFLLPVNTQVNFQ